MPLEPAQQIALVIISRNVVWIQALGLLKGDLRFFVPLKLLQYNAFVIVRYAKFGFRRWACSKAIKASSYRLRPVLAT